MRVRDKSGSPAPAGAAPAVGTEMALHVLAYNLKRAMAIMGIGPLIEAMSAA